MDFGDRSLKFTLTLDLGDRSLKFLEIRLGAMDLVDRSLKFTLTLDLGGSILEIRLGNGFEGSILEIYPYPGFGRSILQSELQTTDNSALGPGFGRLAADLGIQS